MCSSVSATRFELLGDNRSSCQPPFGNICSVLGTEESEVNPSPPRGALRRPSPGCPSSGSAPWAKETGRRCLGKRHRRPGIIREVLGSDCLLLPALSSPHSLGVECTPRSWFQKSQGEGKGGGWVEPKSGSSSSCPFPPPSLPTRALWASLRNSPGNPFPLPQTGGKGIVCVCACVCMCNMRVSMKCVYL